MQWQLERTERWSAERIVERQFEQIRRLAAHAIAHCTYYRGHLAAAGLSAVDELTPESYRGWPCIDRRAIAANQAGLTAASCPKEHGTIAEAFSTRSKGEPTRVLHSDVSRFFAEALVVRDHLWHQRRFSEKFAALRFQGEEGRMPAWSPAIAAVFESGEAVTLSATKGVDAQLDWLLREEPGYLLATPSNLQALVLRSKDAGRVPRRLREVLTYAEVLPAGLRELVRRLWQVPLADSYSCGEIGPLALQCPGSEHYHVQAEAVYVEVLRDDGAPCSPGEPGRVVVTPLHNFAMPLLRYEVSDAAALGEACSCGRGLPVIQSIRGELADFSCLQHDV